jgi:hypothetical protein
MKRAILAMPVVLFLLLLVFRVPAQTHLSVDIRDPAYEIIQFGELRGALSRLSAVKPYSFSQVSRLLDEMWEKRELFSPYEQEVLQEYIARFEAPRTGLANGNVSSDQEERRVEAGVDFKSDARVNVNQVEDWHLDSVTRAYLRGDLTAWLSYWGSFGFTFDRVREEAFPPYLFTKEWDAFHIGFGTPRYSKGDLNYPTFSYDLGTDITAQFYQDELTARLARMRREWGIGDGSLTLSGTARPFLGLEAEARLAPWVGISYLTGSLGDWAREPAGINFNGGTIPGLGPTDKATFQKLFVLQRLELFPWPWLYVSASSSVIGAKRFELGYLSPLIFSMIYQNLMADLDNVGVGVDLGLTWAPYGKAYFSFYADEMEISNLAELFTRPRNMFALQGGIQVAVPWLPLTMFTFQYTKIEPFTYAHYPTRYAETYPDVYVETSYTHDGENLAYYLWPNSDEFLVKLWTLPLSSLSVGLEYRLIRHGDNPGSIPRDPVILGRPEAYLDYTAGLGSYPDKDFLHDGLYDFNHIVTLSGEYTLPMAPVAIGLSYSFCYTFWEPNASSYPDRPDEMRNIIGLSVRVFR